MTTYLTLFRCHIYCTYMYIHYINFGPYTTYTSNRPTAWGKSQQGYGTLTGQKGPVVILQVIAVWFFSYTFYKNKILIIMLDLITFL